MDFPAFSSICSSNKAECDVNAVWISVVFCSSCRFVWGILCRWEDEETKRRRDKKSKSQRDEGTKSRRDKGTKGQRDEETKRRREEETKGQEDENHVTSYSCPLHLLFTSSLPLNSFNSCTKTFARFVFHNSFTQRTPLCESSVKVNVGGKVRVGGKGRGCAVNLNYNTASSNNVFVRNPHIFIFHMTSFI